jgi:hypothetical protein
LHELDNAAHLFINATLANRSEQQTKERMLFKDPPIMIHINHLYRLFPVEKFIYMVRVGRDVAYSHLTMAEMPPSFEIFLAYFDWWTKNNLGSYLNCKLQTNWS